MRKKKYAYYNLFCQGDKNLQIGHCDITFQKINKIKNIILPPSIQTLSDTQTPVCSNPWLSQQNTTQHIRHYVRHIPLYYNNRHMCQLFVYGSPRHVRRQCGEDVFLLVRSQRSNSAPDLAFPTWGGRRKCSEDAPITFPNCSTNLHFRFFCCRFFVEFQQICCRFFVEFQQIFSRFFVGFQQIFCKILVDFL